MAKTELITEPNKDLAQLAARINEEHAACGKAIVGGLEHAIEAGKMLAEVKAELGHGAWLPWVAANCDFTRWTAGNYMRVAARARELGANGERVPHLSFRDVLKVLARKEQRLLKHDDVREVYDGAGDIYESLDALIDAKKKYPTIYLDPPWKYSNQGTRASTQNHYETMTVDQIADMPIRKIAADNAHIHLWTTEAFLADGIAILSGWGFVKKSTLIWVKPQMGMGNYWRLSHEYLLFGLCGDLPFRDKGEMSWVREDRARHSAKPEVVREKIERVSPGPYLELFARWRAPGWDAVGHDLDKDLLNAG